ncbi:hypothetical protein RCZ04_15620 [Capnocytophaga sp. HP1101]
MNVFNYMIIKPGMEVIPSFSLEGLQALVAAFAVPFLLFFDFLRKGDVIPLAICTIVVFGPLLLYIVIPSIFKIKSKNYFLNTDVAVFIVYGLMMLFTLAVGISAVIAVPAYIFMLYFRNLQYKKAQV